MIDIADVVTSLVLTAHKAGRAEQHALLDNAQQAIDSKQREIADLSKQLRLACSRAHDANEREEMAQAFVEDIREELGCSHTEILQAIRRLQGENLRLEEENTAYSFASAFTRECLEDAQLGRLVRQLSRRSSEFKNRLGARFDCDHIAVLFDGSVVAKYDGTEAVRSTITKALLAAGVQDPQQETTAR